MVKLVVKGTTFPDEFTYECSCKDTIAAVCDDATSLLNTRHLISHQLFSMRDLTAAAKRVDAAKGQAYEEYETEVRTLMKSPTVAVTPIQFGEIWRKIRDMTVDLFPGECVHKDGPDAAIDQLYALHENPDIDEDYRVHIFHCRAILDPKYRSNELVEMETSALWFNGKEMPKEETIGKYCGNNEKSKITVKVSRSGSVAPSKEPQISYEEQRKLRQMMNEKRETFKTLEESELRSKIVQQTRDPVRFLNSNQAPDVSVKAGTSAFAKSGVKTEVTTVDGA